MLKLIARIHDPTTGDILVDGKNIQDLRVKDLRRAISVLFQDYTHFPLSVSCQFSLLQSKVETVWKIKENIGLGDPEHAKDQDKIMEAAKLGGAEEFINALPGKFNTYLRRPVGDCYSGIPEGTRLFGKRVSYNGIRSVANMGSTTDSSLSGGQMQRLALYVMACNA